MSLCSEFGLPAWMKHKSWTLIDIVFNISCLVSVCNCVQWTLHVLCVIKKVVLWNRYLWGTILILFSFANHMKPHDTRGRTFREFHSFYSVGNRLFWHCSLFFSSWGFVPDSGFQELSCWTGSPFSVHLIFEMFF